MLQHIDCVDLIIKLKSFDYSKIVEKYKIEFLVHGDDWKKGPQKPIREKSINIMKNWKGKVIDVPYTKSISSSLIKKKF